MVNAGLFLQAFAIISIMLILRGAKSAMVAAQRMLVSPVRFKFPASLPAPEDEDDSEDPKFTSMKSAKKVVFSSQKKTAKKRRFNGVGSK